ncbi:MAG: bifunctional 5,10-methylenetetrahydrofolate dehydrogenase/5,10-methenyltetrahydrofolate cyclohydrolase [Patescibacteria group bacterium]|jgi:methylenetetrahydrofolate dehydrogenase (NADP+)/methenyltetrahydrofolate cyclohydrolase
MPAEMIDGKAVARKLDRETAELLAGLKFRPGLAAVLVGDDPASHLYVSLKEKACAKLGIDFRRVLLPAAAGQDEVLAAVRSLNADPGIDGIIVQLPLPAGLDADAIIGAIDPAKDADGFHPANLELLDAGRPRLTPGLAAGIIELARSTGADLAGLNALVIANSRIFFRPLTRTLSDAGARPSYLHPDDPKLAEHCREADFVIIAVGRANFLTGALIKPGAIIIDVGTNRVDGRLTGDVEAVSAREAAGWLTPVPGGVGPVTVAMLVRNTVELAIKRR